MKLSNQIFLNLLEEDNTIFSNSQFYSLREGDTGYLSAVQMASLYTKSALLVTTMSFLKEQLWLKNKEDNANGTKTTYENFITPLFVNDLISILFLKEFLIGSGPDKIKKYYGNQKS